MDQPIVSDFTSDWNKLALKVARQGESVMELQELTREQTVEAFASKLFDMAIAAMQEEDGKHTRLSNELLAEYIALCQRCEALERRCDSKSDTMSADTERFIDCTKRVKVAIPTATSLENGIEQLKHRCEAAERALKLYHDASEQHWEEKDKIDLVEIVRWYRAKCTALEVKLAALSSTKGEEDETRQTHL